MHFLVIMLALLKASAFSGTTNYCAVFDATQSQGMEGYFGMTINSKTGQASYGYRINLNGFANTGNNYDISALPWHIHTSWVQTPTTITSGAIASCAAGNTGGHYDPNLACGPASQQASTSCTSLGRTPTSNPSYIYGCNPTSYNQGQYALCEVGDLSGKFGNAVPVNKVADTGQTPYWDPQAPYSYNYITDGPNGLTTMWSSIVFHAKGGERLLCAKLVLDTNPNSVCNSNGIYGVTYTNGMVPDAAIVCAENYFTSSQMVSTGIVVFFVTLSPFFLFWLYKLSPTGRDLPNSPPIPGSQKQEKVIVERMSSIKNPMDLRNNHA